MNDSSSSSSNSSSNSSSINNESSNETALTNPKTSSYLTTAINIFTSPGEAFSTIDARPSKLFPFFIIALSSVIAMFWYFSIVDYAWYIDDSLSLFADRLNQDQIEAMRSNFESMSQNSMKITSSLSNIVMLLVIYTLQASYLTLASLLSGDKYRFSHWFSLACWANLPGLLSVLGMMINILLSPNGQLSPLDLDPLTLSNLGMVSDNSSLQTVLSTLNLPIFWGTALTVIAYKQWLNASLFKSMAVVLAPYLLIFGTWAYFALT